MDDNELQQFNDALIDVLILWRIGYASGYSFLSSLTYATHHLPDPLQTPWRQQLDKRDNNVWDILAALRNDVPSAGLMFIYDGVMLFVKDNSVDIHSIFESLLETLWTRYSRQTKPDSTKFNDISRLMEVFNDTNHPDHEYAVQQFQQMQHHAIAYLDASIRMGDGGIGHESIALLAGFNTLHARQLLQIMAKSGHYASNAQAALNKLTP
ncbi:MAG: hypothetical protein ACPG7F_02515 [Aggregatilineales bacterium]